MPARTFHVARPDELQSLVKLTKENACHIARMARVWKIARDKRGQTRWDSCVYVGFSGDNAREAMLFRVNGEDEIVEMGALKYNLALNWCEKHLKQVYD